MPVFIIYAWMSKDSRCDREVSSSSLLFSDRYSGQSCHVSRRESKFNLIASNQFQLFLLRRSDLYYYYRVWHWTCVVNTFATLVNPIATRASSNPCNPDRITTTWMQLYGSRHNPESKLFEARVLQLSPRYNRTKRSRASSDKNRGGRYTHILLRRRSVNISRDARTLENVREIDFVHEERHSRAARVSKLFARRKSRGKDDYSEQFCFSFSLSPELDALFSLLYFYWILLGDFLLRRPCPLPALCSASLA